MFFENNSTAVDDIYEVRFDYEMKYLMMGLIMN